MSALLSGLFARGGVSPLLSDRGLLQAMLDVEAAIARAAAFTGLATETEAAAVTAAARADHFDIDALGRAASGAGNPVPALVRALRERLPEEARRAVHVGATSQDIIDTALSLLAKRASAAMLVDLDTAAGAAATLASRHRSDLMLGRTLLQHAVPITFGLKAAGWLAGLDEAAADLRHAVAHRTALQFGGAAGTLAALGDRGAAFSSQLARELDLREPELPWHTQRLPLLAPAMAVAGVAAVAGKIARDVVLLAQSDVAEVAEAHAPGRGESSTMPHKQNPVGAVTALACSRRVPGLLATLLASAEQEHERAAGAWHAEWETLIELLRLTGSASAWLADVLTGLRVDVQRMARNYAAALDLPLAERLRASLQPHLPRSDADALLAEAVALARRQRISLGAALAAEPCASRLRAAGLTPEALAAALSPAEYLGQTQRFIERALAAHGARIGGCPARAPRAGEGRMGDEPM